MKNLVFISLVICQFIILCFISIDSYAQKEELEAHLVLKNDPDTLDMVLKVGRRSRYKNLIRDLDVLGKNIDFTGIDGKDFQIHISEIEYLDFIDLQGIKRVFVDEPLVGLPNVADNLIEVVHKGSLNFYRSYRANMPDLYVSGVYIKGDDYTGLLSEDTNTATFLGPLPYRLKGIDYFQFIDYPIEYINLSDDYGKKKLAEMTKDHFGLYPRLMEMTTYEELLEILKLYDSSPEKVKERTEKLSQKNRSNILDRLSSMPIDSISTKKVYNSDGLKIGDYIKYIGPGPDRIGIVRKITSSRTVLVECDLKTDPKEFQVRISDVELIIE
ncbi:hypothetical protein HZR84_11715 [Hyphobacterium sp. CCMP332]|nr:hypothetical protein HZR84_11715 [Hyphobacterium sp. CCMP332]